MGTGQTLTIDQRKGQRHRLRVVGTLIAAAVTLAACGGGSPTGSGSPAAGSGSSSPASSPNGGLLAYSKCMRSHGVPNFPDPNSKGVIEGQSSSGSGGSGLDPNSPTYQAAQKACQKYASGGTTSAGQGQELNQALKFAACMRANGVPNFPDPKVVNGQVTFAGQGGISRTPGFQQTFQKCQAAKKPASGS